MYLYDCNKYKNYSSEHLVCEIQNEQLKANFWDGVVIGGLFFFVLGLVLMGVICWCSKRERERN